MSSGGRTELPGAMWFLARAEGSPLIVSNLGMAVLAANEVKETKTPIAIIV